MSSLTPLQPQNDVTGGVQGADDSVESELGLGEEDEGAVPLDDGHPEGETGDEGGLIDEKLHYHVDEMTVAFRHSRDIAKVSNVQEIDSLFYKFLNHA